MGTIWKGDKNGRFLGWFFPVKLIEFYMKGRINAEQMVLLAVIDSVEGGRWTNAQLANAWHRSSRQVGRSLAVLVRLGLVRVREEEEMGHHYRVLEVAL